MSAHPSAVRAFLPAVMVALILGVVCWQPVTITELAPAADPPAWQVDVAAEARAIDALVVAGRSAAKVLPNPSLDDERFLRRAWLDLGGRIPTLGEAREFLADAAPDRRERLLDRIARSEAWTSHTFTFLADLLRVESRLQRRYAGQPWIDWLKDRLRSEPRFDRIATDMLTAEGPAAKPGNGATGFWMRDAGMPLDQMATTVQVFLGTRVGCAQCHDHPFDTWKRLDFYRLSAFTSGVRTPRPRADTPEMRKQVQALEPETRNILRQMSESVLTTLEDKGGGKLALPADWQYPESGKPGLKVEAHPLFGEAEGANRAAFATWVVQGNPRFATVIANRMWKRMFGLGLIEPVDDLKDGTAASDPALMAHLSDLMRRVNYDLRTFQRILAGTDAWQRTAGGTATTAIAGPRLRRLRAEQLWDSLLALAVDQPEANTGANAAGLGSLYERFAQAEPQALINAAKEVSASRARRAALQAEAASLRAEVKASGKPLKDMPAQRDRLKAIDDELESLGGELGAMMRAAEGRGPGGTKGQQLRASELPQPAPDGHPLRVFGQSDRQVTDNAILDPSTPQVLALMNGPQVQALLTPSSQLGKAVAASDGVDAKVRTLYLAILSRSPTAVELASGRALLASNGPAGAADLAWVLVNCIEFRYVR